ncbi:MFS transporter [[Clostridium] polysaccharolyticum]|uniref:Major Facilitator Superfamily protein n=1 Tax=[Clostridium] polysaccharolyticum TaxID=29364 RepID=A0A1I0G5X5_9FIRM|nr:MFS transporter [[Clostridium] polysaccharolyticum]SET66000.1 hypothetical protein SAMN04487772_1483 [[Clostridium] polysaccharolyticum]
MRWSEKITYLQSGYNGTRMLIGAINSLFLLSQGVNLGSIALFEMIQTITVLCMEVPTGVIADVISRKLSVQLSCILLVIYYPLMYFGAPNMCLLVISQVIYALALCLMSGSFEGWQTAIIKREHPGKEDMLNYYGHLKYEVNSFITMFSGTAGAVIVYLNSGSYFILYIMCAVIMFLLFFAFSKVPCYKNNNEKASSKEDETMEGAFAIYLKELKEGTKCCFANIHGRCYFVALSLLSCTYQVVFFYWQPYFTLLAKKNTGVSWFINSKELLVGVVFFVYCFSRFFMNRIVRKRMIEKKNPFIIAVWSLLIACLSMIGFSCINNVNIALHIVLFAVIQGTVTIAESIFQSQFIKKSEEKCISSTLSILSSSTSILSIGVLLFITKNIMNSNMNFFFLGTVPLYILLIAVALIWNKMYFVQKEEKIND